MTVTIGSQTNVPDPGSPILSPWAQDTSRKLVHQFASTAARDAWASPPDGAMCVTIDADRLWQRKNGAWSEIIDRADGDGRYVKLDGGGTVDNGDILVGTDPNTGRGIKLTGGTTASDLRGRLVVTAGPAGNGTACVAIARSNGTAAGPVLVALAAGLQTPIIGTIAMASATSVAYNTTSDPRLKSNDGPVNDPAGTVARLGAAAFAGRWIDPATGQGSGDEWVFLSSHDIEEAAPFAVTGERDAVDDDGQIMPQQANYPALVPLLCAAIAQLVDRVEALEGGAT